RAPPARPPARARGTTDVAGVAPEQAADLTAAPEAAAAEVPPELVAQTLGEYLRAYGARISAGEGGVLPVLAAMFAIILVFWSIRPNRIFLQNTFVGPCRGYTNLAGQNENVLVIYNLMWGTIEPTVSWIGAAIVVLGLGLSIRWADLRRRRSGLVAPPASLTATKIGLIAVVAIVVVAICNSNRANIGTLEGVPWMIPIVLAVLGA